MLTDSMTVCRLDASQDYPSFLGREIIKGEVRASRPVANFYGTKNANVIEFSFTIVKSNKTAFSATDIRTLNRQLTSTKYPRFMVWTDTPNTITYRGLIDTESYLVLGKNVYGITYKFTSNSPYVWSDITTSTTIVTTTSNVSISYPTDEMYNYGYPSITLNNSSVTAKTYTITNTTDNNRSMTITVPPSTTYYIDTEYNRVLDDYGSISFEDLGWENLTNLQWIRLVYGANAFVLTGAGTITFSFRYPMKDIGVII